VTIIHSFHSNHVDKYKEREKLVIKKRKMLTSAPEALVKETKSGYTFVKIWLGASNIWLEIW